MTTTTKPEDQPSEPKQSAEPRRPTPNCFGPAFGRREKFVRWVPEMDLILARLGLNQDRASVVRQLVSFWSPKKDNPWGPTVWASADTIAKRLNKNKEWVESTLHELITGTPQKARKPAPRRTDAIPYISNGRTKMRKPPKEREPQKFPVLLKEDVAPTGSLARRYDLTPLWDAIASVDISDVFPDVNAAGVLPFDASDLSADEFNAYYGGMLNAAHIAKQSKAA